MVRLIAELVAVKRALRQTSPASCPLEALVLQLVLVVAAVMAIGK